MRALKRGMGGIRDPGLHLAALTAFVTLTACEPARERETADLSVNSPLVVGSDTVHVERIRSYLTDALGFTSRGGQVFCSYAVLGQEGDQVFLGTVCEELVPAADSLESGGEVEQCDGRQFMPKR